LFRLQLSTWVIASLALGDVPRLRPFRTIDDLELDRHTLLERPEPVALNGRVVHEDVTASVALDEPVTLGVVEPLDLTCDTHRSSSCLLRRRRNCRVVETPRQPLPRQKKRPRCAAFPFRRQARPA